MKLVARGDTTVVDAYLSPILRGYVESGRPDPAAGRRRAAADVHAVERRPDRRPLASRARTRCCRARPAASSAWSARPRPPASTGSSASTWAAPRPTCRTTPASSSGPTSPQVAGVRVRAPMIDIHTVAAGGGSILDFDGARMRVGPDSAGADPGPRRYRNGGPLDRHRLQRRARPPPSRVLPGGVRSRRRPAARRGGRPDAIRGAGRRGRRRDR